MNHTEDPYCGMPISARTPASEPELLLEDPRVIVALEEYRAALEAGQKPDRHEFQARHPDISRALAECLDGLEFVHTAAPQLQRPVAEDLSFAAASAADVPLVPLGDYRILREIGRGGMGVVYEAEQLSLGRRVALKVLPFAAALDGKQLQRFKNEAHAAAHLHHTNIVPVYAVGCERGVHFYAMQFIEGQTLAGLIRELRQASGIEAMDQAAGAAPAAAASTVNQPAATAFPERSTTDPAFFRTVARLGVQAAEALAHAHAEGVVHRDIKPANLLLDVKGKIWVTDFGLAQLQGDAALTMTGDLVGTIRYMSPEQALARRLEVDHRTDIYSLGATLYELSTLEPALDGRDRQELLRQIALEDPRSPQLLNKAIPRELETIVLKAMEKNPADRYGTAQELADDLKRFLEDKQILARRPTLLQRTRRWARRNKQAVVTATVAAVVLLLAALAALTVSIIMIAGERDEARQQRQQAQKNFEKARQAVDEYFTLVSENILLDVPGMQPLRKELLEATLRYYRGFLEQHNDDPEVQAELVVTHFRLAKTYLAVDSTDAAILTIKRGLAIMDGLRREHRDLSELAKRLAGFHKGGRRLHHTSNYPSDPALALAVLHQAGEVWERFSRENPTFSGFQSDLAANFRYVGELQLYTGHPAQALVSFQKASQIMEKLVHENPQVPEYRADLAEYQEYVGIVLGSIGRHQEAELALRQGLADRQKLVKEFPHVPYYRESLAESLSRLTSALSSPARRPEAERAYQQAMALWEKLVADFPSAPGYQRQLALTQHGLGNLLRASGRLEEAEKAYRDSLARRAKLAADFPGVASYRRQLARAAYGMADMLRESGRSQEAQKSYRQALTLLEKGTDSFDWFFRAMAHWQLGEKEQARQWFDQAVQWMEKHRPEDQELLRFRAEAAKLLGLPNLPPTQPAIPEKPDKKS